MLEYKKEPAMYYVGLTVEADGVKEARVVSMDYPTFLIAIEEAANSGLTLYDGTPIESFLPEQGERTLFQTPKAAWEWIRNLHPIFHP